MHENPHIEWCLPSYIPVKKKLFYEIKYENCCRSSLHTTMAADQMIKENLQFGELLCFCLVELVTAERKLKSDLL